MSQDSLSNDELISHVSLPEFMRKILREEEKKITEEDARHYEKVRQTEIEERMISMTRVRLAGFDPQGEILSNLDTDIHLLGNLETHFTGWIDGALSEAPKLRQVDRDEEGLTPALREYINMFHESGGHTSAYSYEQRKFIIQHGIVAFIELMVREDVYVTVGAVTGLSSNPCSEISDPQKLFPMFPQFDLRDVHIPDPDQESGLSEVAAASFLTCRSSILPSTDHPFIQDQLGVEQMPAEFRHQQLPRHGLPSKAKSVAFLIAQKFGNTFATSNIGAIKWGTGINAWKNIPSTSFNDWMSFLSERKTFRLPIDPISRLRVSLNAYIGSLDIGIDALIGEEGIATRKGHSIESIQADAERYYQGLIKAIESKQHAPWGNLDNQW